MSALSRELRRAVRARALGCCEYCRFHEDDLHAPFEPDHVVAVQHAGAATLENLALACLHCNRRKGTNLSSVDPTTGAPVWLFNPRRDHWADHFRIEEDRIVGITPAGRATVNLLEMNAEECVLIRGELQRAGRYPLRA